MTRSIPKKFPIPAYQVNVIRHLQEHPLECTDDRGDDVIAGSAIVEIVERNLKDPDAMEHELKEYVPGMRKATRRIIYREIPLPGKLHFLSHP